MSVINTLVTYRFSSAPKIEHLKTKNRRESIFVSVEHVQYLDDFLHILKPLACICNAPL